LCSYRTQPLTQSEDDQGSQSLCNLSGVFSDVDRQTETAAYEQHRSGHDVHVPNRGENVLSFTLPSRAQRKSPKPITSAIYRRTSDSG